MTIDEANELIAALRTELCALDGVIREEKNAVIDKYSDARYEILRKQGAAKQALQDAETAAVVPHKYEGEKVFQQLPHRSWEHPKDPIFGVIQTYTPDMPLPDNMAGYMKPRIGETVVRLLKKNGEPGLKINRLSAARRGWTLVRAPSIVVSE
jgi:hypothetical protein